MQTHLSVLLTFLDITASCFIRSEGFLEQWRQPRGSGVLVKSYFLIFFGPSFCLLQLVFWASVIQSRFSEL